MTLVRLIAYLPNGADQGAIPTPQGLSVSYPLNDIGACTWSYASTAPRIDLLGQPLEVATEVSTDNGLTWAEPRNGRFLYLRDGRDPVKDDALSVECPAYILRLRKALVGDASLTAGKREFSDASPGEILNTLLGEAQARGALQGLSWDFTATEDSSGAPWAAGSAQTIGYDPGADFLTILQGFADAGLVDYCTEGRMVRMFNADAGMAADRSVGANPVTLRFGRDLTEAPYRRTWEALADTALVIGDNSTSEWLTNGSAETPWGRQETYVSASGVTDTGTLTTLGNGALAMTEAERIERTYGLDFTIATSLPFRDYWTGEWVLGSTDGTEPQRMRVRQVTLTMSDQGQPGGNVVLNDRFLEADILQQRRLDKLMAGATGATTGSPGVGNDILAPAQVTGLTGTSTSYLANGQPMAQITLDWAPVTTNADATPITDLDHYEVYRRRTGEVDWAMVATTTDSAWTDSPYFPAESWDFQVRAVDHVFNRGALSDVETVATSTDTTAPGKTSAPVATSTTPDLVTVDWDGLSSTGGAMAADLARVEVHASLVNDFAPVPGDSATLVGRLGPEAGSTVFASTGGTTQHVKLVPVDSSSNAGPASDQDVVVVSTGSDGVPPAASPDAIIQSGIGSLFVGWAPVVNDDHVEVDVHVSATAGFAPSAATLAGTGVGTGPVAVRALPDGTPLSQGTTYYVRLVARDLDGAAPAGLQAAAQTAQVTGPDIAASSITGDKIVANTITADRFSATLALVSALLVGDRISIRPTNSGPGVTDNGIRVEMANGGHIYLPADGTAADFAKVTARFTRVDIDDNLTVNGSNNALGGTLTMKAAISPPTTAPQVISVDDPAPLSLVGPSGAEAGFGFSASTGKWLTIAPTSWSMRTAAIDGSHQWRYWDLVCTVYGYDPATGARSTIGTTTFPAIYAWQEINTGAPAAPALPSIQPGAHISDTVRLVTIVTVAGYIHPQWTSPNTFNYDVQEVSNTYLGRAVVGGGVWVNQYGAVSGLYAEPGDTTMFWSARFYNGTGYLYHLRFDNLNSGEYGVLPGGAVYPGINPSGLYYGNGDFGAARWLIAAGTHVYAFTPGVDIDHIARDAASDWDMPDTPQNLAYTGGRFWSLAQGAYKVRKFSTVKAATLRSCKYTWYNTSAGTESTPSPAYAPNQAARRWFQVTAAAIPASSNPAAPDAVRIYVDAHRQAALAAGATSATYEVPDTALGDAPGVNGFAALNTAGVLKSEGVDAGGQPYWQFLGDGTVRLFTSAILPLGGPTVPKGALLCDGASYLRADYPALARALGHPVGGAESLSLYWGAADATHFYVPDLRHRTLFGAYGDLGTNEGVADVNARNASLSHGHSHTINDHVHGGVDHLHGIFLSSNYAGSGTRTASNANATQGADRSLTTGGASDRGTSAADWTHPRGHVNFVILT